MTVARLTRRAGRAGLAAALATLAACSGTVTSAGGQTFSPNPSPTGIPARHGITNPPSPFPTGPSPPGSVTLWASGNTGAKGRSGRSPLFYVTGVSVTVTSQYECEARGDSGYFTAELHANVGGYERTVVGAKLVSGSSEQSVNESVPGPGDYYLSVGTNCPWQVTVTAGG